MRKEAEMLNVSAREEGELTRLERRDGVREKLRLALLQSTSCWPFLSLVPLARYYPKSTSYLFATVAASRTCCEPCLAVLAAVFFRSSLMS